MNDLDKSIEKGIKCFKHCSSYILCFQVPGYCPICSENMVLCRIPLFVLKCPLIKLETNRQPIHSCTLLLQPTDSSLQSLILDDGCDLHIAVVDSNFNVFDFDFNGLNVNSRQWFDQYSILLQLKTIDNKTREWNLILNRMWLKRHKSWSNHQYNVESNNCLDFVVKCLSDFSVYDETFRLNKNQMKSFLSSIIEPTFKESIEYLRSLIEIKENGFQIKSADEITKKQMKH
jgi:hypothetical protein